MYFSNLKSSYATKTIHLVAWSCYRIILWIPSKFLVKHMDPPHLFVFQKVNGKVLYLCVLLLQVFVRLYCSLGLELIELTNLCISFLGRGAKLPDSDQDAGDEPHAADQQPGGDSAPALADTCVPALQACWHSHTHH